MSQDELAAKANLARPYISRLENGHSQPTAATLEAIARALELDVRSFFGERGQSAEEAVHASARRVVPVFDPGVGRDVCAAIFQNVSDGERPAGQGEYGEPAESADPNAFYVVARGRSMTGGSGRRSIEEGDLLLVEPNRSVRDGDIVLCRREGGAGGGSDVLVKTFKLIDGGRVALVALHHDYAPLVLSPEEAAAASFLRVTEIKRKL